MEINLRKISTILPVLTVLSFAVLFVLDTQGGMVTLHMKLARTVQLRPTVQTRDTGAKGAINKHKSLQVKRGRKISMILSLLFLYMFMTFGVRPVYYGL